jgi:hypothetical protein
VLVDVSGCGYDGSCGKGGRGVFTRGRVGTAEDMVAAVLGARREQMIYSPCVRASVNPTLVDLMLTSIAARRGLLSDTRTRTPCLPRGALSPEGL